MAASRLSSAMVFSLQIFFPSGEETRPHMSSARPGRLCGFIIFCLFSFERGIFWISFDFVYREFLSFYAKRNT